MERSSAPNKRPAQEALTGQPERDQAIYAEYVSDPNATHQSLAEKHGLLRAHVSQIIAAVAPAEETKQARAAARAAGDRSTVAERHRAVYDEYISDPDATHQSLAEKHGISPTLVHRIIHEDGAAPAKQARAALRAACRRARVPQSDRWDVLAWVEDYVPTTVYAAPWISLRAFVVAAMRELAPTNIALARRYARTLCRIGDWAVSEGLELNRDALLHPDTVERFVNQLPAAAGTRKAARALLRRMGWTLTRGGSRQGLSKIPESPGKTPPTSEESTSPRLLVARPHATSRVSGSSNRESSSETAAWALRYTPKAFPQEAWSGALRVFVLEAVIDCEPRTLGMARDYARALILHASFCVEHGIDLERRKAFHPDTIEQGAATFPGSPRNRLQLRSLLRLIGRKLNERAPWEIPVGWAGPGRPPIPPPYSDRDMRSLQAAAWAQPSPILGRFARAVINLCAGAGLTGAEAAEVTSRDVVSLGEGLGVQVGWPRSRAIPVLRSFESELQQLAEASQSVDGSGGLLLGGAEIRIEPAHRAHSITSRFHVPVGVPKLSTRRLRSTWLTAQLRMGTRLPELMQAVGTKGLHALSQLLPYVELLDEREAIRQLQGRT